MINKAQLHPVEIDYVDLAEVEKPPIVYKYRTWNKNVNHDNLLYKNQIYLSAPSDFEDKLDCKNPTRYDIMSENETRLWIEKVIRREHPKYNDKAIRNMVLHYEKQNRFKNQDFMRSFEIYEWNEYNKMTGILSVTHNPLSEAMWAKYADNHSGIAYGFKTDELIRGCKLGGGGYVQYVADLPVIHPLQDIMVQSSMRVFHKTKDWEFEEEYRLRGLAVNGRVRVFPNSALDSVILGREFDMSQLPIIHKQLKIKGGQIKLFKIQPKDGTLEMYPMSY